jgi:hypothetical protein
MKREQRREILKQARAKQSRRVARVTTTEEPDPDPDELNGQDVSDSLLGAVAAYTTYVGLPLRAMVNVPPPLKDVECDVVGPAALPPPLDNASQ